MQAKLKLFFMVGIAGLLAVVLSMTASNTNRILAEGSGQGEKVFQANCIACHSIGGGNRVGPDLSGVAKERDKEWLTKMIKDPKALVDSGDETVKQLVEQYGMVMPTLHLSDEEIASIITYLEASPNQGVETTQGNKASQGSTASQSGSKPLTLSMFALYGLFGVMILYGMIAGIWRERLKGVRRSL